MSDELFPVVRVVIADCDDEKLAELRGMFSARLAIARQVSSPSAEKEAKVKLGAVEFVMRERGLID